MSRVRLLFFLSLWLVPTAVFAGKDKDKDKDKFDEWRPVEQWETQIKEVPGNPGAPVIQLYYGLTRDDPAQFEFIYNRIKVLNEKGKSQEYADVEIELGPSVQLADLKARTIHPDGKIVDFDGHVFDKTIVKSRGFKISGKSFSFPDVTVGSILEYKYRLTWKGDTFFYSIWPLQQKAVHRERGVSFPRLQGHWPGHVCLPESIKRHSSTTKKLLLDSGSGKRAWSGGRGIRSAGE